jgi:hypothetical protein
MLGPPRYRQGRCVGPSPAWGLYWIVMLYAGIAGYEVIGPWFFASLPPLFSHISGLEWMLSAAAGLSGIVIAATAMSGAAYLFDRLTRAQSESSTSAETTVQPSQETES